MTREERALLDWLRVANGEPVCVDATWPKYAREGRGKPATVRAAEGLLDLGLVRAVHDVGPGLWVRPAVPKATLTRVSPQRVLESVLDATPADKALNVQAIACRAGLRTHKTRHVLAMLVAGGHVVAEVGRTSSLYRRKNPPTSC